jgi:methylated-DNA-[protein]-cysteine S-methyltransferase
MPAVIYETARQLDEYFAGKRFLFDLPLLMQGTAFQLRVWNLLRSIPFGETWSYLQLAKLLGNGLVIRAAASANGKNPFAIVVPCHRVIGSNGSLTGYAGGIEKKKFLLDHEARLAGKKLF